MTDTITPARLRELADGMWPSLTGQTWATQVAAALRAAADQRERDAAEIAREEREHAQTLADRDALQDAFDELYVGLIGESPEYSNLYTLDDASNDAHARIDKLTATLAAREALLRRAGMWALECADHLSELDPQASNIYHARALAAEIAAVLGGGDDA